MPPTIQGLRIAFLALLVAFRIVEMSRAKATRS
jgi:hypothetical protein